MFERLDLPSVLFRVSAGYAYRGWLGWRIADMLDATGRWLRRQELRRLQTPAKLLTKTGGFTIV